MANALLVLAAGQGTRMKSDLPKVLHEIAGAPLAIHALASAAPLEPERRIIVVGHERDAVRNALTKFDPDAVFADQYEQLGTGHAVQAAAAALDGFDGNLTVLFGDTPFIQPETFLRMAEMRSGGADLVVLGFTAKDPGRYGRLIAEGDALRKIVEAKDATPEELSVKLCNSGVMMADSTSLLGWLDQVTPSAATGEIYLTEVAEVASNAGKDVRVCVCSEAETQGIDSREDLARAEEVFQASARAAAMAEGVTLQAPDSVHFSFDTVIGRDTVVEPNVVFGPGTHVAKGARIRAFSHLEGATIGSACIVGPYARLRPGTKLGTSARVGNFVEIKNAEVGPGSKINHLSYIGDAKVGSETNIGAGTITCNYDGVLKHRTIIGDGVFVGSNTMLIAPVRLGDRSMTASGSVITDDVEADALAIGRAKQINKPGFAERFFARLRGIKARSEKEKV